MSLAIGSLFSGLGGLELGLEAAIPGAHTRWQVEREDFPRSILAHHWPDADRRVQDVRLACRTYAAIDGACFQAGELEPVDLICGGFPCQDLSVAGRGRGLSGAKSGLWFEFLRIIRHLRPRFVVVENVPALLTRGLGTVLGGLAESGYNAEWSVLSAADVGAHHLRRRLFIVAETAHPHSDIVWPEQESKRWGLGEGVARLDGQAREMANADRSREQQRGDSREERERPEYGREDGHPQQGASESRMGVLVDGLPDWLDERASRTLVDCPARKGQLKALGNAVVPQCAYVVGLRVRQLMQDNRGRK